MRERLFKWLFKREYIRLVDAQYKLARKPETLVDVIDILEETQEKFSSREMVNSLSQVNVSDYERGKVAGKIEMLSYLMMELANRDNSK